MTYSSHIKYDDRYLTLVILFTPVTLVTLFRSYNHFYRVKCITVSGFFFVLLTSVHWSSFLRYSDVCSWNASFQVSNLKVLSCFIVVQLPQGMLYSMIKIEPMMLHSQIQYQSRGDTVQCDIRGVRLDWGCISQEQYQYQYSTSTVGILSGLSAVGLAL